MDAKTQGTYDNYLKALMDISKAITSDLYLEDILKLIVIVTAKVMGVDICSLWLVDGEGSKRRIRLKATQSLDPDYVQDRVLHVNEGVVGFVVAENRPLIVEDIFNEPRFKEKQMARKLGLASMVSVPMNVKANKVIGVLNCFTSTPYRFTETEVNIITTVSNQAAVAIMNTELMVKTRVIEEELETRKLVDRAKEVLMRRRKMTGAQAFRWIQKRSMDSRKSILHVAEAVLLSDEL